MLFETKYRFLGDPAPVAEAIGVLPPCPHDEFRSAETSALGQDARMGMTVILPPRQHCDITAPLGVLTADSSPDLAEAANTPSTLCAEGSLTGAASASANTAALSPGFSAANLPTGTTCVSAGAEPDPSVAGAVSHH